VDTGPRRDAELTRQMVLRAARIRFAQSGYGDVTIRGVADDVGVSAPLVLKYFGSKKQLFCAAADLAENFAEFLDAPDSELGRHMVEVTLDLQKRAHSTNPFLASLFMAGRPDIPAAVVDGIHESFTNHVAARLDGEDVVIRAELITAQILGLSAMVRIFGSPGLCSAPEDMVVEVAGRGIQQLVNGS
jgi:AcrR family transcriptional regulator